MVCSRPYAPGMEPAEAARKLAEDKRRYDERFTMLLNHAYLTDAFRTAQSAQAQTAQQEKAPAAS